MKIIGFIWHEKIIEKLEQKHNVLQYEVREVFENDPKFRYVEKGFQPDENVYAAFGRAISGRYSLYSLFTKQISRHLSYPQGI